MPIRQYSDRQSQQNTPDYVLTGPPVADYDNVYIGDVKWKDVDGNGKITEDDRKLLETIILILLSDSIPALIGKD